MKRERFCGGRRNPPPSSRVDGHATRPGTDRSTALDSPRSLHHLLHHQNHPISSHGRFWSTQPRFNTPRPPTLLTKPSDNQAQPATSSLPADSRQGHPSPTVSHLFARSHRAPPGAVIHAHDAFAQGRRDLEVGEGEATADPRDMEISHTDSGHAFAGDCGHCHPAV